MTKQEMYKKAILEAYQNGNKKAIACTHMDKLFELAAGSYKRTVMMTQLAVHEYVCVHAMPDDEKSKATKLQAAKSAVFDMLKGFVDNVPGCICDAGDLTFLMVAGYRLVKDRDETSDTGTVLRIGNRSMRTVSVNAFQIAIETMLAHKTLGREWSTMGEWVAVSAEKAEKIRVRIEKRTTVSEQPQQKKAATPKKASPAKAETVKKAEAKQPASKKAADKKANEKQDTAKKATPTTVKPVAVQVPMTVIANPDERRLDGTRVVKSA